MQQCQAEKKTPVSFLFKDVTSDGKVAKVKCLFCSTILSKNGSRMVNHIENARNYLYKYTFSYCG